MAAVMRPIRRRLGALGVTAAAAVVALACSSCSTSSPAATVNGQDVPQSVLTQQLEAMASSPAYVTTFDEQQLQSAEEAEAQAEEQGQSTSGIQAVTLQGTGTGPDDYSLQWAVMQLNRIVNSEVVSQYLASRHMVPTGTEVTAAWDAEDANASGPWGGFTPQLRSSLAEADADHALIETKVSDASSDKSFYKKNKAYFWSQVCLTEVDLSQPGPEGVNMSATRAQAEKLVAQLNSGGTGAAALTSGQYYCLDPEQLIEKPVDFAKAVRSLAVGKAAAVAGSGGYQVVLARSRAIVPLDQATEKIIDVVSQLGGYQGNGYNDTPLIDLLKKADVQVNPQYGAWDAKPPSPYAPQALSPRQLLTS